MFQLTTENHIITVKALNRDVNIYLYMQIANNADFHILKQHATSFLIFFVWCVIITQLFSIVRLWS